LLNNSSFINLKFSEFRPPFVNNCYLKADATIPLIILTVYYSKGPLIRQLTILTTRSCILLFHPKYPVSGAAVSPEVRYRAITG